MPPLKFEIYELLKESKKGWTVKDVSYELKLKPALVEKLLLRLSSYPNIHIRHGVNGLEYYHEAKNDNNMADLINEHNEDDGLI